MGDATVLITQTTCSENEQTISSDWAQRTRTEVGTSQLSHLCSILVWVSKGLSLHCTSWLLLRAHRSYWRILQDAMCLSYDPKNLIQYPLGLVEGSQWLSRVFADCGPRSSSGYSAAMHWSHWHTVVLLAFSILQISCQDLPDIPEVQANN